MTLSSHEPSTVSAAPDDAAASALEGLLATRWSCRAFRPAPVSAETIARILEIAGRTPSWCNTQPWHVDVLSGSATDGLRAALADAISDGPQQVPDIEFPQAYEGAYQERRRESGWQLYESLGIAKGDRAASARQTLRNFDLFDAPHTAIITTEQALGAYGAVDCGLFVNSFLLAAHSLGVAAIPQAALASQAPTIRRHLGLPENRLVLLGISFGYADLDHPANSYRTSRQSLTELATFHD